MYSGLAGGMALSILMLPTVKGEGQNIDDGAVARLEQFIDDSVVGDVIQGLEDKARDTAAGRITEALVQVGIPAARGAKIAGQITSKTITAIKGGNKVGLKNKNLLKGAQKANELNKGARFGRFAATTLGGAAGASIVYDIEDIGTFGDMLGAPGGLPSTDLDRETRSDAGDDAVRRLENMAYWV